MRLRILISTAAAALVLAAPAQADDASLFTAYTGHAAERDAANKAYIDAVDEFDDGSGTDTELLAIITANKQINSVIGVVHDETAAQEASTEQGAKAKKLALREFELLRVNNVYENRALAAYRLGKDRAGGKWLRRQKRMLKQYHRTYLRAHRAFKAAGFTVPPPYGADE